MKKVLHLETVEELHQYANEMGGPLKDSLHDLEVLLPEVEDCDLKERCERAIIEFQTILGPLMQQAFQQWDERLASGLMAPSPSDYTTPSQLASFFFLCVNNSRVCEQEEIQEYTEIMGDISALELPRKAELVRARVNRANISQTQTVSQTSTVAGGHIAGRDAAGDVKGANSPSYFSGNSIAITTVVVGVVGISVGLWWYVNAKIEENHSLLESLNLKLGMLGRK